ncbi:uncharacterized protein M421DRAFT_205975 [Didymella exigua CBS 183.55]|uniref:Uncharacterized protein n=1 Tax=Didymella exigua CBS 183.55 TaxID=1150837 RepID=A0A6A5RGU5_9PLEO|nr:uncharacterized protein M421DRAFT_205975 [Didymella exigua CBS 183.55]KAF1926749.1 hypothetical protein M421DRAFT_205975 [Didymella exigua CBS 183.55]
MHGALHMAITYAACQKRSTPCHHVADSTAVQGQAIKRRHVALKIQNEAYVELLARIQTSPDNELLVITRRIRMGVDVESVLTMSDTEATYAIECRARNEAALQPSLHRLDACVSVGSGQQIPHHSPVRSDAQATQLLVRPRDL